MRLLHVYIVLNRVTVHSCSERNDSIQFYLISFTIMMCRFDSMLKLQIYREFYLDIIIAEPIVHVYFSDVSPLFGTECSRLL